MKKFYLAFFSISTLLMGANTVQAYPTGSNFLANYSGIPNGTTCNMSTCHTGGAVNSGPGSVVITTDIPVTGYIAGTVYQITVTVNSGGANGVAYGFSCSATKTGTATLTSGFAASDNSTLAKSSGAYIVHKNSVNGNGATSHAFVFNWTAPASGTGSVTFYAAGNSANGNGSQSGDQIYNGDLVVEEAPGAGLTESILDAFNLFPNPATEYVNIRIPDYLMDSEVRFLDITGKVVFSQQLTTSTVSVDLNQFRAGLYSVQITKAGKSYVSKLMKN